MNDFKTSMTVTESLHLAMSFKIRTVTINTSSITLLMNAQNGSFLCIFSTYMAFKAHDRVSSNVKVRAKWPVQTGVQVPGGTCECIQPRCLRPQLVGSNRCANRRV